MRSVIIRTLFGIFAITAVEAKEPMRINDLDHFVVDCSKKKEQIEFLESMRPSQGDKILARFTTKAMPWQALTDPEGYRKNKYLGQGGYDWLIRQKLYTLATQCY